MKQIKDSDDVRQLGTILCVFAHPDDETFTCAGIMATAIQNGQTVVCVTATKGEEGVQDQARWPREHLGEIREHEMQKALEILGCRDHHWLGYLDGQLSEVEFNEAVAKINKFIEKVKPNTILTFGPDGLTGHPDHQTVSKWVEVAAKSTNIKIFHAVEEDDHYNLIMKEFDKKFDFYFNIDKPPVYKLEQCSIAYKLPPEILVKKRAALQAQSSQTEHMFKITPPDKMVAMLELESFVLAPPTA